MLDVRTDAADRGSPLRRTQAPLTRVSHDSAPDAASPDVQQIVTMLNSKSFEDLQEIIRLSSLKSVLHQMEPTPKDAMEPTPSSMLDAAMEPTPMTRPRRRRTR